MHTFLHRSVQFYTPSLTPLTKEYQTRHIRNPEVKKTLKEMKNNKTPGIHNMASGVVIFRGEESVK